ncbi:MAG TPA: Swt1 family HEPN domain-containing protein [Methylomirabilota bacterium]|nr:Swt1 family HEPN domain-containing protein [Methylomirabilota bacterium]
MIERQVDLWPVWRETEIALRNLITAAMLEQYGDQWIDKLEKARPNLKPIFERCREAQQKEEGSFGSRASRNLIDFTYPQDLFAIIFAEWHTFKPKLKKDKNYWDQRAQLLTKIRNPLAHNRDEVLYEHERQIAEGYCKEILGLLKP